MWISGSKRVSNTELAICRPFVALILLALINYLRMKWFEKFPCISLWLSWNENKETRQTNNSIYELAIYHLTFCLTFIWFGMLFHLFWCVVRLSHRLPPPPPQQLLSVSCNMLFFIVLSSLFHFKPENLFFLQKQKKTK